MDLVNSQICFIAAYFFLPAMVCGAYRRFPVQGNPASAFQCAFTRDTCEMKNQEKTKAFWLRKYITLDEKTEPCMVVEGNLANNNFARLMTPDIYTRGVDKGCLTFRYAIHGRSAPSLSVIKQGYVTQYIFYMAYPTRNKWTKAQIDVDLLGDVVMFYFEADTKVQEFGESIVAIKYVRFSLGPCL